MRLIGNKTKLLGEIQQLLLERGIAGGTLIDVFCGSASVGRHFKRLGFRVIANDRLSMCYAQAVAGIAVGHYPGFRDFREKYGRIILSRTFQESLRASYRLAEDESGEDTWPHKALPLLEAVHFLNLLVDPREGLIFRSFSPGGTAGRRYFRDDNGRKIDGILEFLRNSYRSGLVKYHEFYLLLVSLLDAADRVANISGTYGAFLKSWQSSSLKDIVLRPRRVVESSLRNRAYREDGNRLSRKVGGDVLYVDPPYNRRQYAANYHVMEIMAEYHTVDDLDRFERSLYGETGLRPYDDLKSLYCVPPGRRNTSGDALTAMTDLILSSRAKHVVVSYNEEGLLSLEQIGELLAKYSGKRSFNYQRDFRPVIYKRFRSDRNRRSATDDGTRTYRVIEGRKPNEVAEWLFFATRTGVKEPHPTAEVGSRRKAVFAHRG